MKQLYSILFSISLLVSQYSGLLLQLREDYPRFGEPRPVPKATIQRSLQANGLHGEVIGSVAFAQREYGEIVLDFSNYVNGRIFDMVAERMVEEILNQTFAYSNQTIGAATAESIIRSCYLVSKETFVDQANRTMEKYSQTVRHIEFSNRTANLQVIPIIVGFLVGSFTVWALDQLKTWINGGDSARMDTLRKELSWNLQEFTQLADTRRANDQRLNVEFQIRLMSSMVLNDVGQALSSRMEVALDEMLLNNKLSKQLVDQLKDYGVWKGIRQFMGDRWAESLLKEAGWAAASAVKVQVLGMNMKKHVLKIQVSYPASTVKDLMQIVAIGSHGEFSKDGQTFMYPIMHKHYAVLPGCESVDCFWPVNLDSCQQIGPNVICDSLERMEECRPGHMDGCRIGQKKVESNFVFTRTLYLDTIVATNYSVGTFHEPDGRIHIEAFHAPIFVVSLPYQSSLSIGRTEIRPRLQASLFDLNVNYLVPTIILPIPTDKPNTWSDRHPSHSSLDVGSIVQGCAIVLQIFLDIIFIIYMVVTVCSRKRHVPEPNA